MTTPIVSGRVRASSKKSKPSKPRRDFPLTPHPCGQWVKRVNYKLHYFGPWDDPDGAEDKWDRQKEALRAGREPEPDPEPEQSPPDGTVKWLCDVFMDFKQSQHDRGELSRRALDDYHATVKRIADFLGRTRSLDSLGAKDFERFRDSFPDTWGPTTTNNVLRLVRVVFKYADDIVATDRRIPYRIGLKGVPRAVVRRARAEKPAKEFTAAEAWTLYEAAETPMRAFILLGLNAGYGTMDIARLRIERIDFANHWLGEVRGKTGIARGAWLWPETIAEIRKAIDAKPFVGNNARLESLAFLTKQRRPWGDEALKSNPLTTAFRKLKTDAGISKPGVGHYAFRHTFATVASGAGDQHAVDFVMGHVDSSMSAVYREGIDPDRVKQVCQHVRQWWLDGKPKRKRAGKKGGAK